MPWEKGIGPSIQDSPDSGSLDCSLTHRKGGPIVDHKPRVLFFSTGDSTRSQIAEGFLRAIAGHELVAVSTATKSIEADPLACEVMKEVGIDISGQRAQEVAESFREHFSYVITVCDSSRERFPVWPFTRNILHWSLIDPEQVQGPAEQKREVFRRVRDEISRKVREFVNQLHGNQWSTNRVAG